MKALNMIELVAMNVVDTIELIKYMRKKSLVELQNKNKFITDKNSTHSYLPIYDKLFLNKRDKHINLIELGIYKGGSALLWKSYFENANIFCLDRKESVFNDDIKVLESNDIITMLIDYNDVTGKTFDNIEFDIVIDDLSHDLNHQIKTFEIFRNKLSTDGILIIEDIRPANLNYWKYIEKHNKNCTIIDLKKNKNRYDDVLFIYKNI